jgi:hypothetical protein
MITTWLLLLTITILFFGAIIFSVIDVFSNKKYLIPGIVNVSVAFVLFLFGLITKLSVNHPSLNTYKAVSISLTLLFGIILLGYVVWIKWLQPFITKTKLEQKFNTFSPYKLATNQATTSSPPAINCNIKIINEPTTYDNIIEAMQSCIDSEFFCVVNDSKKGGITVQTVKYDGGNGDGGIQCVILAQDENTLRIPKSYNWKIYNK